MDYIKSMLDSWMKAPSRARPHLRSKFAASLCPLTAFFIPSEGSLYATKAYQASFSRMKAPSRARPHLRSKFATSLCPLTAFFIPSEGSLYATKAYQASFSRMKAPSRARPHLRSKFATSLCPLTAFFIPSEGSLYATKAYQASFSRMSAPSWASLRSDLPFPAPGLSEAQIYSQYRALLEESGPSARDNSAQPKSSHITSSPYRGSGGSSWRSRKRLCVGPGHL
ncbi:uncharacterized protein LOC123374848 [Mauremys mutica]|uniref:uncharacterized protein LOC123374848 n=1 Tax=Mauremys mutica TaxID=74926 RepID=UPI001D165C11|nr:uncharacterized protein LOC123374848 [Mauremys mutica]